MEFSRKSIHCQWIRGCFSRKTLNIEPGVEIRINNLTSSNIYIETRGTINCVGTDALPIKIHAMYDTMNNVAWQGFVCTSSQGGVLNADRFQIANAYFPFLTRLDCRITITQTVSSNDVSKR